ncbi:MAG TPA: PSD1 and planctomycete cytochrome C domain-containing protein [Pirellulales bacterium]|nr:PSD1 and planctomycete cytochrome C domain-containing protein [Pirellulales bacterium]
MTSTVAASAAFAAPPGAPKPGEFFELRVRPLLVERCVRCHGSSKQESGLRLDSREAVLKGGGTGPAIVIGKPEESLLILAVKHESLEMPPDEELPAEEIAALETWIRQGAAWPGGAMESSGVVLGDQKRLFAEAKTHWAFQPVRKPPVPKVNNTEWARTPIDAFVLAKLESEGMQPSATVDRRSLLRRLSFDLIGLPPTEQEVLDFIADRDPKAVANVVDRLLTSPHYGERWGRHWLDIARYSDMRDFIPVPNDRRYPYAYTYRDWVIRALNRDIPYDEFVRQQLAADAYTDDPHAQNLAALGLLMVGPRFINNANEQIADRIDMVGRGFLGLAVTCARCHDHKYDPIPTTDYYALYGVFNSCEEPAELPTLEGMSPPPQLVAEYDKAHAEKVAELDKYGESLRDKAYADLRQRPAEYLAGVYEMAVARSDSIRGVIDRRKVDESAMTPLADNFDRLRRETKWQSDSVLGPLFSLLVVIDKNFAGHLKKITKAGTTGERDPQPINPIILAALRDHPPANKQALLDAYGEVFQRAADQWQQLTKNASVKKSKQNHPPTALANADLEQVRQSLFAANDQGPFAITPTQAINGSRLFGNNRNVLAKYEAAIKEVESTHPGSPARAFMLVDKPKPGDAAVFVRGDPTKRGERVPRRFLSVLDPQQRPFTHGSGRRDLAEAIADPKNPLTARVFVNRVWMHHFGKGLCDTPGDFGFRSSRPSHPDLLDWLAADFMEHGWSMKRLHRQLVLSNAYRQASHIVPEYAAKDPENRLLWRVNRRRLDFESMRDAMLACSGQLDETIGGRAVPLSEQPFTHRRTVYGLVDRLNIDPIFTIFDFANPDVSTPERAETTIPQQALFGMNHPFVIEQARAMCRQVNVTAQGDEPTRLRALYEHAFGRKPSPVEVKVGHAFLAAAEKSQRENPSLPVWQCGYGPGDPSVSADDRFTPMTVFINGYYQPTETYPDPKLGHVRLNKNGGHPGKTIATSAIRRWRAPCDTTVDISGTLTHLSDKGDGVRARIISSRGVSLEWVVKNDKIEVDAKHIHVKRGDTIDFIIDPMQTNTSDGFNWAPVVRISGSQRATSAEMDVWDARADFAPPPPPPLSAWEQLAQALLLTNEFLFLD